MEVLIGLMVTPAQNLSDRFNGAVIHHYTVVIHTELFEDRKNLTYYLSFILPRGMDTEKLTFIRHLVRHIQLCREHLSCPIAPRFQTDLANPQAEGVIEVRAKNIFNGFRS
jgi:hypothetical protein